MRQLSWDEFCKLEKLGKTDPRVKAALEQWEAANIRVEDARHAQYKAGIEFAQQEDALANMLDEYNRNEGK